MERDFPILTPIDPRPLELCTQQCADIAGELHAIADQLRSSRPVQRISEVLFPQGETK
jgi:hypothetical protein